MKRLSVITLFLITALLVAACGSTQTEAPVAENESAATAEPAMEETGNSIVDIAVNDGRFETLVTAVTAAGLAETLSSDGPFTVFAPTDDAFAALPEGTVEALLADPEGALTNVLLYHVVDGKVMASDVVGLDSATTLSGEDIAISVTDAGVFLNDKVAVIITDIEADNGVIHVIDAVLLPPSTMGDEMMDEKMSIAEIAVADGNFTTLVAALEAAGLVDTLAGEGNFTVFAPTDDAFAALPEGTVEALLEDPQGALTDILLYHVVDGKVMASDVVNLDSATTLSGEDIAISADANGVFLNETVAVVVTDIEASNGVIHVIDAVLLPPSDEMMDEKMSIAEIAVADGNFTTLVAALEAAGLVDTLAGEGDFTVFAPTDDAFAALPEGTVEALLEDPEGALKDILLYHVVAGSLMAENVARAQAIPALQGENIAVSVDGETVMLNDTAVVVSTDIEASNGVIHVIDAVILPPSMNAAELPTIAEIAAEAGTFNTLLAALEAAGLAETFAEEGSYTVFAPTDDAFAALPAGTIEALLEDPEGALKDILLYHVAEGEILAENVVAATAIPTLFGQDIMVTVDGDMVFLNDTVMVTVTDIMASNGVVHVIDAVLIPAN